MRREPGRTADSGSRHGLECVHRRDRRAYEHSLRGIQAILWTFLFWLDSQIWQVSTIRRNNQRKKVDLLQTYTENLSGEYITLGRGCWSCVIPLHTYACSLLMLRCMR